MQKLGRFFRIQGVCRMWVCQNGTRAVSFLSSVCVHVYVRVCVCVEGPVRGITGAEEDYQDGKENPRVISA